MIGCKMMRTLASVEFEIILILGLPCCLSSSSVRCLENVSKIIAGSDVDVGRACLRVVHFSLRLLVEMSQAIRQTYLVKTESPESPHTVASPTPLLDSTPPTRNVEIQWILTRPVLAHMAVRVSPAMLPGLSASIAKVASMFDLAFCKRFRSSYESSPLRSPPDLPSRKRYQGTSELVDDDEEEDKEIEESLDSDSESEDAEDEGPTAEDEDPAAGDDSLAARDEGLGLGGDAAVPK
ncbi:hypothetical protein Tco_1459711, partial [Tanacetum coccineum]